MSRNLKMMVANVKGSGLTIFSEEEVAWADKLILDLDKNLNDDTYKVTEEMITKARDMYVRWIKPEDEGNGNATAN